MSSIFLLYKTIYLYRNKCIEKGELDTQEIRENLSELFSIFPIEDSFTKLWTNDDMIRTIPPNMRFIGIFLVCGVHGLKKGYDVSSRVFLQSLGYHNLFSSQRLQWQSRYGSTPRGGGFRQMD